MPEFDLDNLKKTWQEQDVRPKYDSSEILKMLNSKSRNYVKYIFWISVVEFLFFLFFGLYSAFQNKPSTSLNNLLTKLGVTNSEDFDRNFESISIVLKIFSLLVTAFFAFKFYRNFKKINIEENLKSLITRIIDFKKTVNAFIFTNIIIFFVHIAILVFSIVKILNQQHVSLDQNRIVGFIAGIVGSAVFGGLLIWIYYRIIYGIIVKKLDNNLQQLKKIDQENA